MAISYGFFNSVNGDRTYNADDISNYFLKLISNGVFATPSNAMQVQESDGMTVQVSAGWGFINCKWINNDAPYLLTLDAADVVLNRVDRIVLRLNATNAARNMEIAIKKGTAASSPQPPALTRVTGAVWELSLARIYVAAGATSITQANITDERSDTSVCGYVTGLIDQIDTTNLFAQYNAAFNDWFAEIKQTLTTTTLIRQYTSSYTTTTANEYIIPINIMQYNETLDVLNVYINGLKLIQGYDYTKSATSVTLAKPLTVVGTSIEFEVLKSIDGSEAESVVDMVYQLQQEVGKLDANNYYCNGVNDNATFQTWLENWELGQTNKGIVNIIGTFGVDGTTTTASDGNTYSFVYECTRENGVILNFAQCNTIAAKYPSFAYFSGCKVEGLTLQYTTVTNTAARTAITAVNCTLENCDVWGTVDGSGAMTVYNVTGCRMIECDCNVTAADGVITGIKALTSIINSCNITVQSNGASTSAYGVDIGDASRCDNSTFSATVTTTAANASACGGIGGGYFSNCSLEGSGVVLGYGFYVRSGYLFNVNNCIFRGYTKTTSGGRGYGLYGASSDATTLILTGINCNQIDKSGYTQNGSFVFTAGYGSYMGCFYAAPSVPSTIVSYGSFIRNRT